MWWSKIAFQAEQFSSTKHAQIFMCSKIAPHENICSADKYHVWTRSTSTAGNKQIGSQSRHIFFKTELTKVGRLGLFIEFCVGFQFVCHRNKSSTPFDHLHFQLLVIRLNLGTAFMTLAHSLSLTSKGSFGFMFVGQSRIFGRNLANGRTRLSR